MPNLPINIILYLLNMQEIVNLIMPLSIGLIMFGIGLELSFKDFRRVIFRPKGMLTGIFSQIILLPILAFLLVFFWPLDPAFKIGIMLLAACPGGTVSNLVTKMLAGRVALSVSLTAFNSFIILLSIPLVVELSYWIFDNNGEELQLGFADTFQEVLFTVVIPVSAGILLNEFYGHKFRNKLHKPLKYILPLIMLIAFLFVVFFDESRKEISILENLNLFFPLLILNFITTGTGYFVARKLNLRHITSYTIAVEMGLQNSVLALFIANQLLEDSKVSLIPILYGSFSLISTLGFAWLLKEFAPGQKSEE